MSPAAVPELVFGFQDVEVEAAGTGQATTQRNLVRSASGGQWVAKHYGDYYRGREDWVRFECDPLRHLADAGESVARNVPTVAGEPFAVVDGRPFIVYEWAEGSIEWPTSAANARALGAALANLHRSADRLPLRGGERAYDLKRLVDRPLELLKPYTDPQLFPLVERLCERIRHDIANVPLTTPSFGPIHGDIHQGNCHFTEEGKLSIFDFALSGVGYRAYDLTGFLWPMRDRTIERPEMRICCDAFLQGYESARSLLPEERAAIPAFVQVRTLWESGDWVESGGGREQPDDVAKAMPHLLRQMQAAFEDSLPETPEGNLTA